MGSAAQADDALAVKQALHLLEDAMEGVELPSSGSGSSRGVTRAGEFVYALFEHAGITFGTASVRAIARSSEAHRVAGRPVDESCAHVSRFFRAHE